MLYTIKQESIKFKLDSRQSHKTNLVSSEDESTIVRGLWFEEGSWQPLDEAFAERIEEEHMTHFKGMKIEAATDLVKGLKPGKGSE